ncbi:MAG: hypothetical protein H6728_07030 [Myxococcales bacterium]|nr:hypothetical protein [Myxococcales bacterium]
MPRSFLTLFVLSLAISGCASPSAFYRNPRPASYYTAHYCFEVPEQVVIEAVEEFLKQRNFPIHRHDRPNRRYETKPVVFERYGRRWRDYGHLASLHFRVTHSKGTINLQGLPKWALDGKAPKAPKPPQRKDFPNEDAFSQAQQDYYKRLETLTDTMQRGVDLAKTWQGCRIRDSKLRTVVHITAKIRAYKLERPFYTINPKGPSSPVRSDHTIEYSILRLLARRLKRARFMPPLLY